MAAGPPNRRGRSPRRAAWVLLFGGGLAGLLWFGVHPRGTATPPDPVESAALIPSERLRQGRQAWRELERALREAPPHQVTPELLARWDGVRVELEASQASPGELWQVRQAGAQALERSGRLEDAYQAWAQPPPSVPGADGQAEAARRRLQHRLSEVAWQHLKSAEGLLRAGQFEKAEQAAREALRLSVSYGGSPTQQGLAHGALGYACRHLGRSETAQEHFRRAAELYPQGPYAAAWQEGRRLSSPDPAAPTPSWPGSGPPPPP